MPEKKSTSTSASTTIAETGPGGSQLGRASYRAEQVRDTVIIFAMGWHPTPGYVDFFEQSPLTIFPPEFILRTIPPGGIVLQVLTPFSIWVMFGASEPIDTVTVHDADGAHMIDVEQVDAAEARQSGTWVSGNVVRSAGEGIERSAARLVFDKPTTMGTGEEGPDPITTMATGEEQARIATTLAVGEEGPGPTTLAVGEESGWTTLRLGEEGATTLAVGEETSVTQSMNPFGGF